MKNFNKRFVIFAVLGAILSSALLVGCGNSSDDSGTANATPTKAESDQ